MTKITKEEIFEISDTIYFKFIDSLPNGIENQFIEKDPNNPNGTRNTKKGEELFFDIEDYLIEKLVGEENDN